MRKKTINISIPRPCSQSTNQMEQTDKGYFCSACATEVIDYRNISDADLVKSLQARKEKEAKPCGIFRPDQLHRPMHLQQTSCSGFSNTLKALSVLAGLSLAAGPGTLHAQAKADVLLVETQNRDQISQTASNPVKGRYMSGKVTDFYYDDGIRHAKVQFKEAGVSVRTDKEGNFKLFLPDNYTLSEVTLVVSQLKRKYFPEEKVLQSAAMPAEGLEIQLQPRSLRNRPVLLGCPSF